MPNYSYLAEIGPKPISGADMLKSLMYTQAAHDALVDKYEKDMTLAAAMSAGIDEKSNPEYYKKAQEMKDIIQDAADYLSKNGLTLDRHKRLIDEKRQYAERMAELEAARKSRADYIAKYNEAVATAQKMKDTILENAFLRRPEEISYDVFLGGKTPVYEPILQSAVQDTLNTAYGDLKNQMNLNIAAQKAKETLGDLKGNNIKTLISRGNSIDGYNSIVGVFEEFGLNSYSLNEAYKYIDDKNSGDIKSDLKALIDQWEDLLAQAYPQLSDATRKQQLKISLGSIVGNQSLKPVGFSSPGSGVGKRGAGGSDVVIDMPVMYSTQREPIANIFEQSEDSELQRWVANNYDKFRDGSIELDFSETGDGIKGMPTSARRLMAKNAGSSIGNVMTQYCSADDIINICNNDGSFANNAGKLFGYENANTLNDINAILGTAKILPDLKSEVVLTWLAGIAQHPLFDQFADNHGNISLNGDNIKDIVSMAVSKTSYNALLAYSQTQNLLAPEVPLAYKKDKEKVDELIGIIKESYKGKTINSFFGSLISSDKKEAANELVERSLKPNSFGDMRVLNIHTSNGYTETQVPLSQIFNSKIGINQDSTPYVINKDGDFKPATNNKRWKSFVKANEANTQIGLNFGVSYTSDEPEPYAIIKSGTESFVFRLEPNNVYVKTAIGMANIQKALIDVYENMTNEDKGYAKYYSTLLDKFINLYLYSGLNQSPIKEEQQIQGVYGTLEQQILSLLNKYRNNG